MSQPKVLILRAPGTNCDVETEYAFSAAGAESTVIHLNRWLESPSFGDDFQILCVPGGFSFGDDIGAGAIFANTLTHQLADSLHQFVGKDKLVLGICNGFQVLVKTGLLPGGDGPTQSGPVATLGWNDSAKFEDRWVTLKAHDSNCVFLKDIDTIDLPIAHAEGKFVASSESALERMEKNQQLALRYVSKNGAEPGDNAPYPDNPNGSHRDVAGICDPTGRVFGLMPHPERYLDRTQHPNWTRDEFDGSINGGKLFENAVGYFS